MNKQKSLEILEELKLHLLDMTEDEKDEEKERIKDFCNNHISYFEVLRVRDWTVKFQINDLKFLWKPEYDSWSDEDYSAVFLFNCDKFGRYELVDLGLDFYNQYAPCFEFKQGKTLIDYRDEVFERLSTYHDVGDIYKRAIIYLKESKDVQNG